LLLGSTVYSFAQYKVEYRGVVYSVPSSSYIRSIDGKRVWCDIDYGSWQTASDDVCAGGKYSSWQSYNATVACGGEYSSWQTYGGKVCTGGLYESWQTYGNQASCGGLYSSW